MLNNDSINKYEKNAVTNQARTDRPRSVSASRPLSKSQKISVVILAFFAFFTIILWSVQTRKNLSGPGSLNQANGGAPAEFNESAASQSDLYTKDTDEDGLTDWEELNNYKTSPYLQDSDSDGFLDKREIESGHDPNCPEGRDCYGASLIYDREPENTVNTVNNDSVKDFLEQLSRDNLNNSGETTINNKKLEEVFSGESDAATIRQLLLGSGMDKKILDQFNDEELISEYKKILEE